MKRATAAVRDAAKQETRAALIDAGAQEFAEKGLDGPSLDSICARAGFTRGAFYVHFRDRDELLVAVVDRVLTRFQEVILPGEAEVDLTRTIRQFVALVAAGDGVTMGTPEWRFRHTLGACARVPALRARYVAIQRRAVERLANAIAAGQRAGTVRADVAAESLAEILVLLSLGLSAATEVEMPFDLRAGGAAIEALLGAPKPKPKPKPKPEPRPKRRAR